MRDGLAPTPPAPSVSVVQEHFINAEKRPKESSFDLGPLDYLAFHSVPVDNVFVYRKPASVSADSEFFPIDRLKRAIELVLDYYPHLTGRIQVHEDGSRSLVGLGTGTVLLEATCDKRIDEFTSKSGRVIMERLPGSGDALTPPFDPSFEGFTHDPVFSIQHTRFSCQAVSIGIRIHHTVTDAGGYFMFVRHLAELYRGLSHSNTPTLSSPPLTRLYLQKRTDSQKRSKKHSTMNLGFIASGSMVKAP